MEFVFVLHCSFTYTLITQVGESMPGYFKTGTEVKAQ
jgi:hypothetical protein